MKLLQILSGIFGDHSQSTALAQQLTASWQQKHPEGEVVVRDLIADPVPHLDANIVMAFGTPEADRNSEQQVLVGKSDELIQELSDADAVVIGVPMYNFAVPTQLKAYFDQLARAGVTFQYTETGPVGMLKDKPVYVMAARGGMHKGQPTDSQTDFIKTFLGFIGLHDVRFVYAEGVNMGDDAKESALHQAKKEIELALAN
jgi:FMN-dependent NADH-azoreductase